jgi:hypothetical protein
MAVFKRLFFDLTGIGRVNALPGGSFRREGKKRTMVVADTGPVGPGTELRGGEIKFKLPNQAGISLAQLDALEDVTITVSDDGGKTWVCTGAFTTDTAELTNGEISVDMEFVRSEEVK